jgi:hypothetical protein
MRKIAIVLAGISVIIGCRTKKQFIENNTTDTLRMDKVVSITPPLYSNFVIGRPCDSLGKVVPFNYVVRNGKVQTKIRTIKEQIVVEQNVDSIVESAIKEYRSKAVSKVKIVEVYRTPFWFWYLVILNLVLVIILGSMIYVNLKRKIGIR